MELVHEALCGNRRALARLISQVEDNGALAAQTLAAVFPRTGHAHLIGVTGAPGTGKSTLVSELAKAHRRAGQTVGIVAVDPTSPFTGGAILGDRIRMRDLAGDSGVFIRSMATRGSLGGLARATADVAQILDAAGYDVILIETVGAGQSEVDIARAADTTLVVEAPGLGDEVQAIKAGILEIADVLVVNKADREGAANTVRALQAMLDLGAAPRTVSHHGVTMTVEVPTVGVPTVGVRVQDSAHPELVPAWRPPILQTVALEGQGITEVVEAIVRHQAYLAESGEAQTRRRARIESELEAILRETLLRRLMTGLSPADLDGMVDRIAARELDPYTAAEELLAHRR
jgi:LAO/AO transport system kinase